MANSVSVEYLHSVLPEAAGRFIIPFASTQAPYVTCDGLGRPSAVGPLGFGFPAAGFMVNLSADGLIDLNHMPDRQFSFTVPVDCSIENIFLDTGNYSAITVQAGTALFPFLMLYRAAAGSNIFYPIPETKTCPAEGFSGNVAAAAMLTASNTNVGTALAAGERVMLVGHLEAAGTGALAFSQYIYFTGGISFV